MSRLNIIPSIIAGVAFTGVLLGISNATGGVDLLGKFYGWSEDTIKTLNTAINIESQISIIILFIDMVVFGIYKLIKSIF